MKSNKQMLLLSCTLITGFALYAQQNGLTSSPYSLFGLGTQSNANIGKYNGMGKTGIADQGDIHFNIINPASLGGFNKNLFLFDFGVSAELNDLSDRSIDDQRRLVANFSNVAIAFPAGKNAGIGISLLPSTSVGYSLLGLQEPIENSTETFVSNVFGSGGINDIRLSYGLQLTTSFKVGAKLSYLWGKIEEEETVQLQVDGLLIEDENFYGGLQLGLGMQYKIFPGFTFGASFDFSTELSASRTQTITRVIESQLSVLSLEEEQDINNFNLPMATGIGFNYRPNDSWSFNADYKRYFWGETDQEDNIGQFVNQDIMGIGAEYIPKINGLYYWQHINFRAGINYDSGYLQVNDVNIDHISASLGIGFPVGRRGGMLNISYTRGVRGVVEGILVQENLSQFNINLSLSDIWFQKRLLD